MSLLSRLTYFSDVELNIFLQAFEFERRIEDSELQVDLSPKTSSAKVKTRNRAAIGHLIDTLKLCIPFKGQWDSGRLEPVSMVSNTWIHQQEIFEPCYSFILCSKKYL